MNLFRVPPPVPPNRKCECGLCRKARGLEPLGEGELKIRRESKARRKTGRHADRAAMRCEEKSA